jgi:hypothetical protein
MKGGAGGKSGRKDSKGLDITGMISMLSIDALRDATPPHSPSVSPEKSNNNNAIESTVNSNNNASPSLSFDLGIDFESPSSEAMPTLVGFPTPPPIPLHLTHSLDALHKEATGVDVVNLSSPEVPKAKPADESLPENPIANTQPLLLNSNALELEQSDIAIVPTTANSTNGDACASIRTNGTDETSLPAKEEAGMTTHSSSTTTTMHLSLRDDSTTVVTSPSLAKPQPRTRRMSKYVEHSITSFSNFCSYVLLSFCLSLGLPFDRSSSFKSSTARTSFVLLPIPPCRHRRATLISTSSSARDVERKSSAARSFTMMPIQSGIRIWRLKSQSSPFIVSA